jgi:pimeloyl-ACP methyl ester carboxylesterase
MSFIVVNQQRLEARWWREAEPSGAPLVLLHEGLGSVSLWREFPAALAERTGRDVFAYSRIGYGTSDARRAGLTLDFMERHAHLDLPCVLDAAGIASAVLVGHSDGGSIALVAATAMPDRVEAVATLAAHVLVEPLTLASIAALRERYGSSDLSARLARHHTHADQAFTEWADVWLDPRFKSWNIEGALAKVSCPVLALQGLQDQYGTVAQVRAIEHGTRGPVTTALIQDCGHSPHRDQPAAVLHHLERFLAAIALPNG